MKNKNEKPSNRIPKLNSLIERHLGIIILPYIEGENAIVTVSKVDTSRDLKWVKVWITIVNGDDDRILELLKKNIYDIQGELNRELPLKIFPKISFHLDTTGRHAAHISEILNQIHEEQEGLDK